MDVERDLLVDDGSGDTLLHRLGGRRGGGDVDHTPCIEVRATAVFVTLQRLA